MKDFIEKVRTGYYQWLDNDNMSEAALSPAFFPDGILCMDTALRYYGYSDRTPAEWYIAVNKYSNRTRFQIDYPFVKPYYVAPELLKLGLCEQIIDGNAVKMYDKERIISYDIRSCFLRTGSREEAVLSSQDPGHVQYSQKNQCKTNILVQTADNTKSTLQL